jgi:AraC-like DNA-binding protein
MHGSVREQEPGVELYYVVIGLDRRYLRRTRSFHFDPLVGVDGPLLKQLRPALLNAPRRSCPATRRLSVLMPELVAEAQNPAASEPAIASLTRLVLIELCRSMSNTGSALRQVPAVKRVMHFIARLPEECHRPWTLETMADTCNLGRSRFSDILKQATGDTPIMALNRVRVERAQELLRSTDSTITQVALDCGFANSQHFAHVFRQYAGRPARDYRQKTRSPADEPSRRS